MTVLRAVRYLDGDEVASELIEHDDEDAAEVIVCWIMEQRARGRVACVLVTDALAPTVIAQIASHPPGPGPT